MQFQLLQQQLDNLKRTLMSNHIQKQQEQLDHHQEAMTELKLVGQQQVLDQYTFFGEEQPSDILHHASIHLKRSLVGDSFLYQLGNMYDTSSRMKIIGFMYQVFFSCGLFLP